MRTSESGPQWPKERVRRMGYRAILFDVGDTLWHSEDAPPAAEFRRIAAERAALFLSNLGVRGFDAATVARTAWGALESAMRRARATDLIEPDYPAETRAALAGMGLELSREQAGDLVEAIYVSGEEGGKAAYADARRTLDAFRERGFKLGIVTNRAFGGARFREDLHAAGLDIGWDATVVSVEVGVLKPHPGIFRTVLDKLEL